MIVCGGYIDWNCTSSCHTYENKQGWTKLTDMAVPRSFSASISISGGILVTGGFNVFELEVLKSSEMVFLNGTVKQAEPLPEPRAGHCLVEHKGQIISTGGNDKWWIR